MKKTTKQEIRIGINKRKWGLSIFYSAEIGDGYLKDSIPVIILYLQLWNHKLDQRYNISFWDSILWIVIFLYSVTISQA